MIDALAIERLRGGEVEARVAFDENCAQIGGFVRRFLRGEAERGDLIEDAVVRTLERIWAIRGSIQTGDAGGFWGLVAGAASYSLRDVRRDLYGRSGEKTLSLSEPIIEEIPDADRPYLDTLAIAAEEWDRLQQAADKLWLEIAHPRPEFDRWILAAQLYYLDERPWDEVAKIVGPVAREDLDDWLSDIGTINALTFCEIYQDNDTLCAYLLGCDLRELEEVASKAQTVRPEGNGPGGWNWAEALVVVLRYRNGLLTEQILRFDGCPFDKAGVETVFERCRTRLPFRSAACRLLDRLGPAAHEVAESGVWRRLAFQYSNVDDLPLKQIAERTDPATRIFGVQVAQSTLNAWLSGGRLLSQLARYIKEGG